MGSTVKRTVLVCQNRSCKSFGSQATLKAFQSYSIPHIKVIGSGCLGQCGNGPMVVVLPEEIWYSQVVSEQVKTIVTQHLLGNKPVKSLLYPVKHPGGT